MTDVDKLVEVMESLSRLSLDIGGFRTKPLIGGVFGPSGFVMASTTHIEAGLHEVRYYVFSDGGLFFSLSETKQGALEMARSVIARLGPRLATLLAEYRAKKAAAEAAEAKRLAEIQDEVDAIQRRGRSKVKSIGRRRRQIFEESGGKCHYCETVLTLDGKWHIEHKHPRALGGGNEPGNLVASCVPCNMKKRDSTDLEFKARLNREKSATAMADTKSHKSQIFPAVQHNRL